MDYLDFHLDSLVLGYLNHRNIGLVCMIATAHACACLYKFLTIMIEFISENFTQQTSD
jgi:hypothetical protein